MNIHYRRTMRKLKKKTAALIPTEQRDQILKNPGNLFCMVISEAAH